MSFDTTQSPYVKLRDIVSQRTSPVIAWVGAGLSAPAKMPTWSQLREILLQSLSNKIKTFPNKADQLSLQKKYYATQKEPNPWMAFGILEGALGVTSYREAIREAFKQSASVTAPESYRALWDLRIKGLINLNIDRLATKSFISQSNNTPSEFNGGEATRLGNLLKGPQQFIINLHGVIENHQSWIFTDSELTKLRALESYHTFIKAAFCSHTVVFLGLTLEDIAVGGHLEALSKQGIESGPHYWISSRTDKETDEWAERVGVQIIRYNAHGNDHSELIEALSDLKSYIPPEDAPITSLIISDIVSDTVAPLPTPENLAQLDSDVIRVLLNAHIKNLIKRGEINDKEFTEFRRRYDEAIYRSWYVSEKPGKNQFLGYAIQNAVKKGAFGSVYKALDDEGNERAIKLLLEEIRDNGDLTQSFRRGVTSMQILADHKVEGVASYVDSSEIPAFVVMDWIEGPNLEEAVLSNQLSDWITILRCAFELASILRKAHELPERVLHRDLRPVNIMLEDFYSSKDWRVVVLDFDLSWHRGASDRSVVYGATVFGYLAPEQIERTKGVSTRHAGVDVFGLGMLLYFLISRRHPLPSEHQHSDWITKVKSAAAAIKNSSWISVGARYERIIIAATRHQQSTRWDLVQVQTELERLLEAATNPKHVSSMDLIAEEIASRMSIMSGYEWFEDLNAAKINLPTGTNISIIGDITNDEIVVEIGWQNTGVHQYQNVGKWLAPAAKNSEAALQSFGFATRSTIDLQALKIEASISRMDLSKPEEMAKAIEKSLQHLRKVG